MKQKLKLLKCSKVIVLFSILCLSGLSGRASFAGGNCETPPCNGVSSGYIPRDETPWMIIYSDELETPLPDDPSTVRALQLSLTIGADDFGWDWLHGIEVFADGYFLGRIRWPDFSKKDEDYYELIIPLSQSHVEKLQSIKEGHVEIIVGILFPSGSFRELFPVSLVSGSFVNTEDNPNPDHGGRWY